LLGAAHSHARAKWGLLQRSAEFECVGISEGDVAVRGAFATPGTRFLDARTLVEKSDAVLVESDVADHARDAFLVLRAGRHLHVEKPPSHRWGDIERMVGLACAQKGKVYTARISAAEIRESFLAVDGPDVQALVQVGTNLLCSPLVEQLEAELGKPVLAVNTATAWAALRQHGITDRLSGWGRLLSQY
jgi:hypothetical protein